MHSLSADQKQTILSLINQHLSTRKIASQCSVSKSYVQKLRKRHFPDVVLPKAGRPPKLSVQNKRFCVRAITAGKLDTASATAKQLHDELNVEVSDRTVRRAFQEAGLEAMEKEKKPKLSPKNVKERLAFARRHKDWTIEDWKRVIWSDETKINRFCSDGRSWCWIRDGESRQPRHVKETVKHGGGSLMIWGCMTAYGVGFMCKITGNMNQHVYKSILEDELLRSIEWYSLDKEHAIFQHDNDPKHAARSVKEWLNEQPFEVLDWPPQSPDLNPIEHLWAIIKRRLNQYECPPRGMLELWDRIEAEWNRINQEECQRLVESIPRRIEAVCKAKGMWTDY
jgi:transposase